MVIKIMVVESNSRQEITNKIIFLQEKLSRSTVDQDEAIGKEIKALQEEYQSLPPDTINAGDIYLSKKIIYEGSRYRLREYEGKLWLYDDIQCLTDKIELRMVNQSELKFSY